MRFRTLALAAAIVLVVVACDASAGSDSTSGPTTVAPTTVTVPTSLPGSTSTTDTNSRGEQLDQWLGVYNWVEFVEGDPGSDQTLVHELVLDVATATGLAGSLTQNGFQTFAELTIEAIPAGRSVQIAVVSIDEGFTDYSPGDVLLRLSGDADGPVTTIEALATLTQPTGPGTFFVPGPAGTTLEVTPGAVWAVDATTYDLVLVDIDTGDLLASVEGWGPDGAQALQTLEVDVNGRVWVDDCCEPAFGNTFGIDPTTDPSIMDARVRLTGLHPRVAPNGDLVAVAVGDIGVGVFDAESGSAVVDPAAIFSLVSDAEFAFLIPIGWVDDTTIAIAEPGQSTFDVTFVDVSAAERPDIVAGPIEVQGAVLDGDFRADGTVAALTSPQPGAPARRMVIIDPRAPGVIGEVDLPNGASGIDYDASGRNLLVVTVDGSIQPFGESPVEASIGPFVDVAR